MLIRVFAWRPGGRGFVGDAADALFESKSLELLEGKRQEEIDAAAEVMHRVTERLPAHVVSPHDRGGIRHAPVRERGPAGEGGARLPCLIADGDDQIPLPVHDRVNPLWLAPAPVDTEFTENIDREWIHGGQAETLHFATANLSRPFRVRIASPI